MATTTDIIVNQVFEAVFYPIVGWAFVSGYLQNRFPLNASVLLKIWQSGLMRAAVVSCAGQVILTYWESLIGDQARSLYPSLPIFTVCLLSAIVMTARPAGKINAYVGATFASTVLFCILNTANNAIQGRTITSDLMFWRSSMVSAIVLVLLLAGAASGDTGRRIVNRCGLFLNGMAHKAFARKLAR